ncbi:hypothetical protein M885DRAFT_70677 [Pelagophyceae sp. CCMP2097]|nr:hypothetical protein M885DRAFT_70677 [Pelagophyceae sp. CCMP2097]
MPSSTHSASLKKRRWTISTVCRRREADAGAERRQHQATEGAKTPWTRRTTRKLRAQGTRRSSCSRAAMRTLRMHCTRCAARRCGCARRGTVLSWPRDPTLHPQFAIDPPTLALLPRGRARAACALHALRCAALRPRAAWHDAVSASGPDAAPAIRNRPADALAICNRPADAPAAPTRPRARRMRTARAAWRGAAVARGVARRCFGLGTRRCTRNPQSTRRRSRSSPAQPRARSARTERAARPGALVRARRRTSYPARPRARSALKERAARPGALVRARRGTRPFPASGPDAALAIRNQPADARAALTRSPRAAVRSLRAQLHGTARGPSSQLQHQLTCRPVTVETQLNGHIVTV